MRPSYPWFALDEPTLIYIEQQQKQQQQSTATPDVESKQSLQLRQIDVAASFAPVRPIHLTTWIRLMLLAISLHVLYVDVSSYPPHNLFIYMGYLTHWGHVLSIFYLAASFLCTVVPGAVQQPKLTQDHPAALLGASSDAVVGRLVRVTWGLYSTVAPLEIAISLLYWSAIATAGEPLQYIAVMEHGGIAVLVWLDGLVVGLVPVRAKHVLFLMVVCCSYLVWSIVDAVLDIGSGEWGPAYNDDALYPVLNWKTDSKGAALVSAFAICVLSPCLFMLCWVLSLMSGTRKSTAAVSTAEGAGDETSKPYDSRGGCCCFCLGNCDGSRRPLYPLYDNEKNNPLVAFDYNAMGCVELV